MMVNNVWWDMVEWTCVFKMQIAAPAHTAALELIMVEWAYVFKTQTQIGAAAHTAAGVDHEIRG